MTGNYATATQELVALAEEKGALMWKAAGMIDQGFALALTGNASDAIQMILSGITAWRSAGSTLNIPRFLLHLVRAYAELGEFEQAWRSIGEAVLQPIAASTGTFSDGRAVQITLTLAVHKIEAASFLASKLTPDVRPG